MNKYIFFFSYIILITSCKTNSSYVDDMDGMILINGGSFNMGSDDNESNQDEKPIHTVEVSSFWMDETRSKKGFSYPRYKNQQ